MPTQTVIKKVTGKTIPVLKSRVSTRQFRLSKDAAEENSASDLQQWLKRKQSIWQSDYQNPFLDKDQLEEVSQILVAVNPQLPDNMVEFSFKDKTYVSVTFDDQNITLLDIEGTSLHVDSQEAKDQIREAIPVGSQKEKRKMSKTIEDMDTESVKDFESEIEEDKKHQEEEIVEAEEEEEEEEEEEKEMIIKDKEEEEATTMVACDQKEKEVVVEEIEEEEEEEEICEDEAEDEEFKDEVKEEKEDELMRLSESSGKTKKLMNQFNFCERATVTYDNAVKNAETQTKPPTRVKFSSYITQWIIYDSYQEDYEIQEKEKEKGKKEKPVAAAAAAAAAGATAAIHAKKEEIKKATVTEKTDLTNGSNIMKKALILERMINQNMFDDILQDFRYYEDPSDEFRNGEGTLLPLWKFNFAETKKLTVTDIKWNPRYFDLFAVSFGSFEFQKFSSNGCFYLCSLKSPSYPEYSNYTESGIMTLDFHPTKPYLIAVGLHDGTVAVYDIRLSSGEVAIYRSSGVNDKHYGIVWQVVWSEDVAEGESMFYSISSDGNVYSWLLVQNQLSRTLMVALSVDMVSTRRDFRAVESVTGRNFKGAGTCIALHPTNSSIFLIGTEEGFVYKCSTAYLSIYLFVYEAHRMPVNRIDYNKYSPNIFASCSADWSIKIWEDNRSEPLFIFDTCSSVGDVKWAPYSSSVLVAVCADCKTYIFDLNIDKYKAVCIQTVASKKLSTLTRVAFNWKFPVIIVGDDRGMCCVLKLSPNLRVKPKITKKQQGIDAKNLELMKLEKLLSLIREPTEWSKSAANVIASCGGDSSSL